ncbi:glycosyltransferase family 2 protein [Rubrimonas cliftonensis]|uniref:Glycosyltransferase, GT2 family n=1 Tax=Rubrimonas cliftonensis TaxID=89524 RepID=A0A1H4CU53_9RHOB|nr:glycosyltransferase [Rubrimonas cliftonensis]SEA63858.1 Glycosyltransferase, GT2 family [Rubrimonas cliftonensis]
MNAAVIIPHYNDVARLRRCLEALRGCEGYDAIERIVVDNASSEDMGAVAAAFPEIRFVTENSPGAAAARNRGVAETESPLLLFLDADCVPAADWIIAARRAMARPGADVVGGRVDVFDETPPPRSGAEAFDTLFAFDQKTYVEKKKFSVTANMLTSRAVFGAVGPFAPDVSEDIDWCWRAVGQGFRLVYDDAVRVAHPTRSDFTALLRKTRRTERELFRLAMTGRAPRLRWALRALAVAASPLLHAPRVLFSPKLATPGERLRALAAMTRIRLFRAWSMLRLAAGAVQ